MNITNEQKKAIDKIKHTYGKRWKEQLKISWRTGVYMWGLDSNEMAELQRLRNTLGNNGLKQIQ